MYDPEQKERVVPADVVICAFGATVDESIIENKVDENGLLKEDNAIDNIVPFAKKDN